MSFDFERARSTTPARLDVGHSGLRPRTSSWLAFQHDHAAARDAVWSEWPDRFVETLAELGLSLVRSTAPDRAAYIRNPPLGRAIDPADLARIRCQSVSTDTIQIVLSDGLSARAAEHHFEPIYLRLREHLARLGSLAPVIAVRNGRVAAADPIGIASGAMLVVHLIGERPGLGTADSLGCYLTYRPTPTTSDADRKCISNIHTRGLDPREAGAVITGVCKAILERGSSGTDLVL